MPDKKLEATQGQLPPNRNMTDMRAAVLVLSIPLSAEIPPRAANPLLDGPMTPDSISIPTNPEHDKWAEDFYTRVRALCIVHGISSTRSGDIDWMGLALRLIFDYVPKERGEPRIILKRKAGAKPKHSTWEARADRRDLLKLVEVKLAINPSLSVNDIAHTLANKEQKNLPARFQNKSAETLRKQVALAREEAALNNTVEQTYEDLLSSATRVPSTGRGLQRKTDK